MNFINVQGSDPVLTSEVTLTVFLLGCEQFTARTHLMGDDSTGLLFSDRPNI